MELQTIDARSFRPPSCREIVLRNCRTDFYGDEILAEESKFDDRYFASVQAGGATGIWIRGQLRGLADFPEAPHWNNRNSERRKALRRIVSRGAAHGVKVYLYFNEPKGFHDEDPIFGIYPDLKGPVNPLALRPSASGNQPKFAFCTQSAFAESYLVGGFRRVFEECPGIGGVILITASEILSHCFSNVDERNLLGEDFKMRTVECPRCRGTTSLAVVADVIGKIRRGIREADAHAKIVAWNWSWGMYEESPCMAIMESLPADVIVMSDLQRAGWKTIEDMDVFVDEYSFSYLGPSSLFTGTADHARTHGRGLWAKMPVNVTHEFLVVPYLPLFTRLAKKVLAARLLGSTGLMGCWNYGGDAGTPMARLAARVFHDDSFGADDIGPAVWGIAEELYGAEHAGVAHEAWGKFDAAFEWFPFEMPLVYYGPHMHGPGFEWAFTREEIPMPEYYLNKAGRRGTRLSDWCVRFPPEEVARLLEKLLVLWEEGVRILADRFEVADPGDAIPDFAGRLALPGFEDFSIARTVMIHFRSTVGFIRFRLATLSYFDSPDKRPETGAEIRRLLEDEKPRICAMRQIIAAYPAIPVADEAQKALYTVADLDRKLANIDRFSLQEGEVV